MDQLESFLRVTRSLEPRSASLIREDRKCIDDRVKPGHDKTINWLIDSNRAVVLPAQTAAKLFPPPIIHPTIWWVVTEPNGAIA